MSELNQDKKILQDGRKAPLKDVEVSLRDQISEKLFDKLEEMKIGQKVVTLWNKGSYNRQQWLERQKAYLASWDEHLVSGTEGAFEGSSQLHIPMPFTVCKTMHARFLQAIWQDPPFNVKARNEASCDRVQVVSDVMRYYLMDGANYNKGVEEETDRWIWRWITQGSAIMKMSWDCKYTRFVDVQNVQVPAKPIVKNINGQETLVPQTKMVEREVPVTKKVFEGPVWRPINTEDFLMIGGEGDPDKAEVTIESDWLTASDIWTLADRKIFKENKVKIIVDGGGNKESGAIGADLKIARNQNAGKSSLDFEEDHEKYQFLEAYLRVDVDGSGIDSDVVVWVHVNSRELVRATYLHRVSPKGERPYSKCDYILRDGQEYGIGLPEILYPLSQEMDAIHNMRVDSGLIATMPFGFYRASSGIDPETISFSPGSLIPVDNPQTDVYFPQLGNRTVFGMQEEAAIQTMVERLTSISDLNMGIMSGQQGATRTATGSRALIGEMGANLDVFLRRLNRAWKKNIRYTFHMLQKRIPPGLSFRLTGDDGKDYWNFIKTQDDIAGDYDIEVSPNSSTSNPGVQQDNAQQILQMVSNPLAIQMGCVGPGQFYEAYRAMMQALGVKDYGKFIIKPQGYERQLTPIEEADRIVTGQDVPVLPNMDHQGFLELFQHIHDEDELNGQFDENQMGLLKIQAMKHERMMQALQAQQAQQANVSQMRMNAAQGQQQTSLGAQAPVPGNGQGNG